MVEYCNITSKFPYENTNLEQQSFPKQFPFSGMVPRVYEEVKEFIVSCLEFSKDLQLTQTDLDETVRHLETPSSFVGFILFQLFKS